MAKKKPFDTDATNPVYYWKCVHLSERGTSCHCDVKRADFQQRTWKVKPLEEAKKMDFPYHLGPIDPQCCQDL